jgi:hypothetical protein
VFKKQGNSATIYMLAGARVVHRLGTVRLFNKNVFLITTSGFPITLLE